jgi:hypothetical protein
MFWLGYGQHHNWQSLGHLQTGTDRHCQLTPLGVRGWSLPHTWLLGPATHRALRFSQAGSTQAQGMLEPAGHWAPFPWRPEQDAGRIMERDHE